MKEAHVAEHVEKGTQQAKEYTAKSWNFMKGMYANVASQVETVARENGYKVDLGESNMTHDLCCVVWSTSIPDIEAYVLLANALCKS